MKVPKPSHSRRIPKQSARNRFTKEVAEQIIERDNNLCQLCFSLGAEIHHVKFKSQGGRGVVSNGLLLCPHCHRLAHQEYEVAESLRQRMIMRYGSDYYKDRWDLDDETIN